MNPFRSLRVSSGLSQRQLAASAGTSQPTIAAYESGRKSPTLRTVEHIAASVLSARERADVYASFRRHESGSA